MRGYSLGQGAMPTPPAPSLINCSEANCPEKRPGSCRRNLAWIPFPKAEPTFPHGVSDSETRRGALPEGVIALVTELGEACLEALASFGLPTDGPDHSRLELGPQLLAGQSYPPCAQGPRLFPHHVGRSVAALSGACGVA